MTGSDANGQADPGDVIAQCRDASRRLYAAATLAHDAADAILTTGPRPGMAQQVYDAACDLRDLARELALIERQRDNETTTGKDDPS